MPDIVGRLKTPRLAAAPSSPTVGEMYYDTTKNQLLWWNGTLWIVSSDVSKIYEQPNAPTEPTTVGDIWIDTDAPPVLGPVGPQGPAGPAGATGATGPQGPAGIDSSIIADAKGDLLAATAADTLTRLPVGANGAVLLSDSSQATGLKWGQQHPSGTYLSRPAANTVPIGSTYFAIDALGTWLSDGTQWILIDQRPAFGAASILNSAPWTTPYDGMEVLLTDSFSNPAYMWHFRYNNGSGSTYKWEFVGGTEYIGYSSANQVVTTVNTWTNIVASAIAPPRNGEYVLKASVQSSHGSAGNTSYVIFWAGSVPGGVFGPAMALGWPFAGGYSNIFSIGPYKAALAGGSGIGVAAQNNIANGNFSNIQWSMIPTRIS